MNDFMALLVARQNERELAAALERNAAALGTAVAGAQGLGASLVARLGRDFATQSGLALAGPGQRPNTDELTVRERQVLALVAGGLTNRLIGGRLFISAKTASVHVSAIMRKLGVSSRTGVAARPLTKK
ncbi:helix-turn-helix domain-containing protein [Arthrobacter livingstonensis]|nr:helix-turn-helix transcriptional regulator [Arthrobacter livingstonensis]